ncbi:MAG: hypothetical protein USCAAHI_01123 [Beijerinckiaceae bacterium]|nr:MAG: hypothetical protein USCAAHI_01123 [Beijerinckiaceae bacterium]
MPQFVAEIHKAMPLHRRAVLLRLGTNARMIGGRSFVEKIEIRPKIASIITRLHRLIGQGNTPYTKSR